MGDLTPAYTAGGKATMQKTAFAALFLGACALVLVLHVQDNHTEEEVAKFEDPFLKKLELHVIKHAQAALKKREAKQARQKHIEEARKAMKSSLMMAETVAVKHVKKVEVAVHKAKVLKAKANAPKRFTWAELQKGDDQAKENYTHDKVGDLLKGLKKAPKATKENLAGLQHAKAQRKIDAMGAALKKAKADTAAHQKKQKEDDAFGDDY